MKRNHLTIGLAVCLSLTCKTMSSQNTLLVYTKYPAQLNFIDAFNKVLPKKAMWNQKEGGFMLNYDELDNTFVSADQAANFKLSNNTKLTKLIALQANDKISLQKCFTSEKYCCEQLNDKQKKGTEKILAIAVMKKSADKNLPVTFNENIKNEINNFQDLVVEWKTSQPIKEIYLVDVTSLDIVWKASDFAGSRISYQDLESKLNKKLEMNHKYQLGIVLASNPDKKYTRDIDIKDLAFQTTDYHFVSNEVVKIDWSTNKKISNISMSDAKSSQSLWSSTNFTSNEFSLGSHPGLSDKVVPGVEYKVSIKLDNGSVFAYNFMVLLDLSDSEALKGLVE